MPTIRPFKFTALKRMTREQVAVQESLATYLSYRPFQSDFRASLAALLERYLKVPCSFGDTEMRPVSRGELGVLFPKTTCITVIGAAPGEHKILVELDSKLVSFAIDRLLGGGGSDGQIQRALTEIEAGVLSFLLLKVLSHFHTGWQSGQEVALSLDRFASKLSEVQEIVDCESGYHLVGIRVAVGKNNGYARILVPNGLVTQSFSSPTSQDAANEQELAHMRKLLKRVGDIPVRGRVEVATLDLTSDDLTQLEAGDIVVLERHQIQQIGATLEAEAFIKLGLGENGGVRGRIFTDGDRLRFEISELVVQQEPPQGEGMVDSDGEEPIEEEPSEAGELHPIPESEDNLSETEGLLRDVPAPVVVELGRIKLNTTQVTRLRTGQILRLPRGPNDPVDLVVNGKLFARGELIEVDGELGVRLLQVAGG